MRIRAVVLASLCAAAAVSGCASSASAPAAGMAVAPSAGDLDNATRARQVLSRLTFGARPGDVEQIERVGADAWITQQLHPEQISDRVADSVLSLLETQRKQPFELIADHPTPEELNQRIAMRQAAGNAAMKADAMTGGAAEAPVMAAAAVPDSVELRHAQQVAQALTTEIPTAKVLRATLSERQLLEVMVDFWENHFSTALAKSANRYAMAEYDRAVIRPHALGSFRELLGAVAHSPQMLYFLDNWQSTVDSLHPTMSEERVEARRSAAGAMATMGDTSLMHVVNRRRNGLNENYARELMELHTLGVDGGYTQHDVTEVARCFTGWGIDRPDLGGGFIFHPELHDAGEKIVLGHSIAAGRGVEDGEEVLDILAAHASTAHFIAKKLIVHFVSDSAPPALVERVAQVYLASHGDIREVMRAIVTSPEFNSRGAYRAKVKTPFEYVVSALRAMNAAPDTTARIAGLVSRLGEPIFGRQTPDGWPDYGAAWMNAGALLNRVNFGVSVGAGQVPGVVVARWSAAPGLVGLSGDAEAQGVIGELLGGDVSSETRFALVRAARPDGRAPMKRLGDVVGVAVGSPEFQKR